MFANLLTTLQSVAAQVAYTAVGHTATVALAVVSAILQLDVTAAEATTTFIVSNDQPLGRTRSTSCASACTLDSTSSTAYPANSDSDNTTHSDCTSESDADAVDFKVQINDWAYGSYQFIPLPASPALSATATSDEEAGLSSSSSLSSLSDGIRTPPALDLELVTPVVAIEEVASTPVVVEATSAEQKEAVAAEQQLAPASLGPAVAPIAIGAVKVIKAKTNKIRRSSKLRPIPRVRTQESGVPNVERTIFNSEDPDVVARAFSVHPPPAITLDFPIADDLSETTPAVIASPAVVATKPDVKTTYTHKRFRPSSAARRVNAALQSAQVATGAAVIFGGVASAYAVPNKTFQIGSATVSLAQRPDHTRPRAKSLGGRPTACLADAMPKRLIYIDLAAKVGKETGEIKLYIDDIVLPPLPAPSASPILVEDEISAPYTPTPHPAPLLITSFSNLDGPRAFLLPAPSMPPRFKGFRVVLPEGTVNGQRAVLNGARRVVRFGFGETGGWEMRRVWEGRGVGSPLARGCVKGGRWDGGKGEWRRMVVGMSWV